MNLVRPNTVTSLITVISIAPTPPQHTPDKIELHRHTTPHFTAQNCIKLDHIVAHYAAPHDTTTQHTWHDTALGGEVSWRVPCWGRAAGAEWAAGARGGGGGEVLQQTLG